MTVLSRSSVLCEGPLSQERGHSQRAFRNCTRNTNSPAMPEALVHAENRANEQASPFQSAGPHVDVGCCLAVEIPVNVALFKDFDSGFQFPVLSGRPQIPGRKAPVGLLQASTALREGIVEKGGISPIVS